MLDFIETNWNIIVLAVLFVLYNILWLRDLDNRVGTVVNEYNETKTFSRVAVVRLILVIMRPISWMLAILLYMKVIR